MRLIRTCLVVFAAMGLQGQIPGISSATSSGGSSSGAINGWTINLNNQTWYFEGSSITRGSGLGTAQLAQGGLTGNFGNLLCTSFWGSGHVSGGCYNDGVDGSTTAQMVTRYTAGNSTYGVTVPGAHSVAPTGGNRGIYFVDLTAINNDQTASVSAATSITNMTTLVTDAHADGWYVVLLTSPDSLYAGGFTVNLAALDGTIGADLVIDMSDWLPNLADSNLWNISGGYHPKAQGHVVIAANLMSSMISGGASKNNYGQSGYFATPLTVDLYGVRKMGFDPTTGGLFLGSATSSSAENLCFYQGSNGSAGNVGSCINADYNQFNFTYYGGNMVFTSGSNIVNKLGDAAGADLWQVQTNGGATVDSCNSLGACTFGTINGTTIPSSVTLTQTIASGTAALTTSAIASGACSSATTSTATGTATTDVISFVPNGDPTGITGYAPSSTGSLYIWAYPTSNTANFKVCNNTSGSITPSALTVNWRVTR